MLAKHALSQLSYSPERQFTVFSSEFSVFATNYEL